MPLAIEPLHPAYAADRACVNTTKQALDICDGLDPQRTGVLGVALDVYHIWWDPELMPQIARAGKDRLLAFHVCDWLVPTRDILNDRGMMGDGVIDIRVGARGGRGAGLCRLFRDRDFFQRLVGQSRWTRCCAPASSGTGRWFNCGVGKGALAPCPPSRTELRGVTRRMGRGVPVWPSREIPRQGGTDPLQRPVDLIA